MSTPIQGYPWPTEPIIFAAWHDRDKATPGPARLYMKVTDACYTDILADIPRFNGEGHFIVKAAYVDADKFYMCTAELRDLQEALRTKNAKLKGYREALELANHSGRTNAYALGVQHGVTQERAKHHPRRYLHAQIYKLQGTGQWSADIRYGARCYTWLVLPSHEAALAWVLAKMREIHENNYPR